MEPWARIAQQAARQELAAGPGAQDNLTDVILGASHSVWWAPQLRGED